VAGDRLPDLVALFDRFDPIELIRGGAPLGEYEPEARTILPRLSDPTSPADVQRIVFEEFTRWFGTESAGAIEDYESVAGAVWDWHRRS